MGASTKTWYARHGFGGLQIELDPPKAEAAAMAESTRLLRGLVRDLGNRDPQARRVLSDLHARLLGMPFVDEHGGLDTGTPRAQAIVDWLLAAARSGRVLLRRVEARSVMVPLDQAPESALGPQSSPEATEADKSWVGLTLADQDGTPVPGMPYRVTDPSGNVIDGVLDSNGSAILKNLDPGSCSIVCPYVEPHPELSHTVADGEHISGIAQSYGIFDYTTVWSHPDNADLQSNRPDAHVLQAGDVLAIPEVKATTPADKATGAKHPFTLQISPLKLRLTLLDLRMKPMANAAVTVAGAALTADGTGLVEAPVAKTAKTVALGMAGGEQTLNVGGLNPSDDGSEQGWKARLYNMGFLWDRSAPDDDQEMAIALQDFQAEYKLPISGQLDDATKAQLEQSYGT